MNASNQALSVYQNAERRYNHGKATIVDEVLLALWEGNQEQAETIREMALKISMLEMKGGNNDTTTGVEYKDLLERMSLGRAKA